MQICLRCTFIETITQRAFARGYIDPIYTEAECEERERHNIMGNAWFGKKRSSKGVVHPVDQGVMRIKVRMSRSQLNDLIGKVDMTKGNSELGRLIVQECSKGKLHARVVAAAGDGSDRGNRYARGWGLRPIQEHGDDDHVHM